VITESDVIKVAEACGEVPPARGDYLEDDFIMNLLATVVDYMQHTTAVERALGHFRSKHFDEVRTMADLDAVFAQFSDDKSGNTALAEWLWGYKMWTRAEQLRRLAGFFSNVDVVDQASLRAWANRAEFRRDFEGKVKGLGPAVFNWLVMRQGVETVKPDVHLRRFTERVLGRRLSDTDVVDVVVGAARLLGLKAYELDWAIWEHSRGLG
jgi:hypothetical protein